MGLLDSKSRIIDTIITEVGRKKLAANNFVISYYAFSDKYSQYIGDVASGSYNMSNIPVLEAASLATDLITLEADDSGNLLPIELSGTLGVYNGKIVSGTTTTEKTIVSSSLFLSLSEEVFSGSINNFNNLRLIGTKDLFLDNQDFIMSTNTTEFELRDDSPISLNTIQYVGIDNVESVFQDKRLSHIPNFKFLPPINKPTVQNKKGSSLGYYVPVGQDGFNSYQNNETKNGSGNGDYDVLLNHLRGKEAKIVEFNETSVSNNLFCQFFEVNNKGLLKLDVIDFGSFPTGDPLNPNPHVFFVGKVFIDSIGRHTFVNMFTLIFT